MSTFFSGQNFSNVTVHKLSLRWMASKYFDLVGSDWTQTNRKLYILKILHTCLLLVVQHIQIGWIIIINESSCVSQVIYFPLLDFAKQSMGLKLFKHSFWLQLISLSLDISTFLPWINTFPVYSPSQGGVAKNYKGRFI